MAEGERQPEHRHSPEELLSKQELQRALDEALAMEAETPTPAKGGLPELITDGPNLLPAHEVSPDTSHVPPVGQPEVTSAQDEELTSEESERRLEIERKIKPGPAIWRNRDHDEPVVVTNILGWQDDQLFVSIEGSPSGIPIDEIVYPETAPETITPEVQSITPTPEPTPTPEVTAVVPSTPEVASVPTPATPEVPPVPTPPEPEPTPPIPEAETVLTPEQNLDKLRQDYFGAKAIKRSVFSLKRMPDEDLRRIGQEYENLKGEVISNKVKAKVEVLIAGGEFEGKTQEQVNERVLEVINGAYQEELIKENELIQGRDKGMWQRFKERYSRINPKLRIAIGAGLTLGAIATAYTGFGGVSEGLLYAKTAVSGAGAGMGTEAMIASKQEKGKVGAIAKEARKAKKEGEKMTDEERLSYIRDKVNSLSPEEVITELARIRNIGESKGVTEGKKAITYNRPIEAFAFLGKKLLFGFDYVENRESTQELTGKTIELLEQKYQADTKTEALAAIQGRELSPEDVAVEYLAKIREKQHAFNTAQELQLDKQRKDVFKRAAWAIGAGTITSAVTVVTGLVRLDKIQAAQDADKLAQAAAEAEVVPPVAEEIPAHWTPENITVGKGGSYWSTFMKQYEANPEYFGYNKTSGLTVEQFGNKLAAEQFPKLDIMDTKGNEILSEFRIKSPDAQVKFSMDNGVLHKEEFQPDSPRMETYVHDYQKIPGQVAELKDTGVSVKPEHVVDSGTWDTEGGWKEVTVGAAGEEHVIHFKDIAGQELPPGFKPNEDLYLQIIDADTDGAAEAYTIVDDHQNSLIEVSRQSAESAADFKERAIDHFQIATAKVNELARTVEAAKDLSSGDRLNLLNGLGLEFKDGVLSPESKTLVAEVVNKLGAEAPHYLQDQDLGTFIKDHIADIEPAKVGKLFEQGAALHQAGVNHIDYEVVNKWLNNRMWHFNNGLLESGMKSPLTGEKLTLAFKTGVLNQEIFDQSTQQVMEQRNTLMHALDNLTHSYESTNLGSARLNPGTIKKIMEMPAGSSMIDWQNNFGGSFKGATVAKLYEHLNSELGGKLSGGGLQGTVGENLQQNILAHKIETLMPSGGVEAGAVTTVDDALRQQAQELIDKSEALEQRLQAQDLIDRAEKLK